MRLVHFSDTPLAGVLDRKQHDDYTMKPSGLWVSDEDEWSWSEWCKQNSPGFLAEHPHEVILDEKANILYLTTEEDIDAFTYCYKWAKYKEFEIMETVLAIDWQQVAKEYDGIIISPYQWTKRLGYPGVWYYGWDCASGCIWNSKAVKEIYEISSRN